MEKIKIIVADNCFLTRQGLKGLLLENPNFELQEAVETNQALGCSLELNKPNVVIIDYNTTEFNLDTIQELTKKYNVKNILAITPKVSNILITKAFELGVTSHLLKDCSKDEIIEAIYATANGEKFVCGQIVDFLMNEPKESISVSQLKSCEGVKITERELDIIKLVAEGHSNKQIADILFLSTHTVTTHRKNIMNKLEVNNTAGLVMYAIKNNLLDHNKYLFS